jgi:hypothetical protein
MSRHGTIRVVHTLKGSAMIDQVVATPRHEDPIPTLLERSHEAFQRDLNQLLRTHYRQWVAYHGNEQVGFGHSQTELFQKCLNRGLKQDEFIVRSIEPLLADEDLVFP